MSAISKTKKIFQSLRARRDVSFPGFLGNLSGVVEANRNGDVYVTLFTGEVVMAHNSRVPNMPRLPVMVGYDAGNRNLLQVLFAREVFAKPVIKRVVDHDHTWGKSTNVSWIRGEQFLPGLVMPASGTNIYYTGLIYWLDNDFRVVPEQNVDLSASIPTAGALFVLLEVDDAGSISLLEGTTVASRGVLTYSDIPKPSVDKKSLNFAIKLYAGQTMVKQGLSFMDSDIVDLRWSGYGGAGGGTPGGSNTEIQVNDAGAFAGYDTFYRQSNGGIIIGDVDPGLTVEPFSLGQGADGTSTANMLESFGSGVASYIALMRARGTHDAPSAILDGDVIGRIRGRGHDGTGWSATRAEIRIVADGDWSAADHPTRIEIYTTPDGSDVLTLAMTIRSDQDVDIPSGKKYLVDGEPHTHDKSTIEVKNTSGATANPYDVGYINASGEYKTTTTERDTVDWCVVVSGGADNADIIVARRGRVTVNYTGTAPSVGHFLSTSTSAGLAQRETEMHPAIFAVCTSAGSGGTVQAQLLCLTVFRPLTKATDILRINVMSSSDFLATINGAPVGSTLTYNAPSSGNENTIVPASSSEIGNLVLFNTTRGNSALIDSVNTSTNVITFTAPVPAGWANGDTITCRSQASPAAFSGAAYLYEIDLTGVSLSKTRAIALSCQAHDTGTPNGNVFAFIHKYSAAPTFASGISWIADWSHIVLPAVEVLNNKLMFCVRSSGTGTMNYFIVRVNGVWEAAP